MLLEGKALRKKSTQKYTFSIKYRSIQNARKIYVNCCKYMSNVKMFICVVISIQQDKKGITGKHMPSERRTIYQRQIRPSSMLAKSILEGEHRAYSLIVDFSN